MPVFQLRRRTARTIRVQVFSGIRVRSETTSSYVATVRCCRAEVKYLTRMGKTRRFRSSCAKARTRIFCLARDNRVKRHKVHPRNDPGCPPFRERAKRKRQPSSGEHHNKRSATNFPASTTSAYSGSCVSQGSNP